MNTLKNSLLHLILLSFCLVTPVGAAAMTIDDCIDLALEQNPDIRISKEDKQIAKSKTVNAWSTVFPKLTLSSSFRRTGTQAQMVQMEPFMNWLGGALANVSTNSTSSSNGGSAFPEYMDSYSASVGFNQILFGTHVLPAIEAAQYGVALADENFQTKTQSIIFKTKEAYINALKSQQLVMLAKENLMLIETLIHQTQEMVSVGLAAKSDLLRLQLQYQNILQLKLLSDNQNKMAHAQLNILLGQNTNAPIQTIEILTNATPNYAHYESLDKPTLTAVALQNRPDIKMMKSQIKLLNTQAAAVGSAGMPLIFASGALGMANNKNELNYDRHKDWNVMLAGQWKFLDWGEIGSQVDEVKSQINKTKEQESALIRSVDLEITLALNDLELNAEKIKTAETEIALADENMAIATEKLIHGALTNLELIDSQTSQLKAKTNLITARYDFEIAKAKLAQILGIDQNNLEKQLIQMGAITK